jgi:N-acetylmuramoyl-L-alanine amidase
VRSARAIAAAVLLAGLVLCADAAHAARPDATLYEQARRARAALRESPALLARTSEWEKVIMRYRKVVARYPQSGYCDDALLAVGDLYRQMAGRFRARRYADDAALAYRTLVAEYPASRLGEKALFAVFEMSQQSGDQRRFAAAGRAYLAAYPDGPRARQVKSLLRRKTPAQAAALPSPPPPGLVQVFDLRSWSGASSTRVVIYLERRVEIQYDRIGEPDRLWVDLLGTRLHPNLTDRSFPVGDGLLEKVRLGQNRPDAVRVVLDFKDVSSHSVLYLEDPTRLVVDVKGVPAPATAGLPPAASSTEPPPPAVAEQSPAGGSAPGPPSTRGETPAAGLPTASTPEVAEATPPPEPPAPFETPAAALPPGPPQPPEVNRAGSYSLARQLGLGVRRIVIDPGHGGHDPGTIGRGGVQEKDLVLDVALRLERLVRAELGADVVMTRSTDVFVPLEERTAIANSRGADLFLSIHANSSRNARARGVETYFLNFAQDPHAEAVAARENAISQATLKDLQGLVKAIALNSKIDESRDFASSVQEAMVEQVGRRHPAVRDRGVHTAPFYVLIGASMPSVLAEIAFVSNPDEEKLLKRSDFRDLVARSLFRGVRRYLEALDRNHGRALAPAASNPLLPVVPALEGEPRRRGRAADAARRP